MSRLSHALASLGLLAACSGSAAAPEPQPPDPAAGSAGSADTGTRPNPEDGVPGEPGPSEMDTDATSARFVTFLDPDSEFQTSEVHDVDREVVRFDAQLDAMVWSGSGDVVSSWSTNGNDLAWGGSGVAFRVRFGTEAGERRAFFTETDRGTICNLNITAPEALSIRATSELPPDP
jgi:hypothetical protein